MCDNNKKYIYGLKPEIDPNLFQLRYSESAKVIDYSKSQQWQVTSVVIGIQFGILSFFKKNLSDAISIYILIVIVSISLIGILLNILLSISGKKHRSIIKVFEENCFVDSDLEEKIIKIKKQFECARKLSNCIFSFIYITTIIFSLSLSICLLKERSLFICNLINSVFHCCFCPSF